MNRVRVFLSLLLLGTLLQTPSAMSWDPQPTNPFPGVPFEGEIPGYTVEVPCKSDGDCGIGIVPVVNCPAWSAADGRNGYANDGPPGDPHKKVGLARRFCRNSWTPPTSAADDEDFRNRQNLAIAAATLESQSYNASHPGEQKCVTWGPIVHANGISTASGGVCANPVGTTPSGTTVQVAPSQVGSTSSGSSPSSDQNSTSTTNTSSSGETNTSTVPTTPTVVVPDYSEYGIGKPFTKKLQGPKSTSECPSGYQAASNFISGVGTSGITECWPENAWAAYSVGGATWSAFKQSNGSLDVQAEQARVIQVNALRALALQNAQKAANETLGLKRCISWSGFGESGQECAYVPVQSNSGITPSQPSVPSSTSGETSTTTTQSIKGDEILGTRKYSEPGVSRSQWEASREYLSISCPLGSAKSSGIDLNGTAISNDDRWFTYCVPINLPATTVNETATVTSIGNSTGDTTVATTKIQTESSSTNSTGTSQPEVQTNAVAVTGSSKEISSLISKITEDKKESAALNSYLKLIDQSTASTKTNSVKIPSSTRVKASSESLTPGICKVYNGVVVSEAKGLCEYSVTLVDSDGNKFTVTKSVLFKK